LWISQDVSATKRLDWPRRGKGRGADRTKSGVERRLGKFPREHPLGERKSVAFQGKRESLSLARRGKSNSENVCDGRREAVRSAPAGLAENCGPVLVALTPGGTASSGQAQKRPDRMSPRREKLNVRIPKDTSFGTSLKLQTSVRFSLAGE
jgi:hypothetical protein